MGGSYAIQRKRFLVDRVQYRLLAVNLFHSFLILAILAGVLFIPLMIRLQSTTISPAERQEAADQFLSLNERVWPALLLVFVLLALHLIMVSHKIAGPLYRFRKVFDAVGAGDLAVRATLREGDFLGRDADSINAMIASLRARIRAIQDQHGEVPGLLAALRRRLGGSAPPEVLRDLDGLEARAAQVQVALSQFATGGAEAHGAGAGEPAPPPGGPSRTPGA